MYLLKLHEHKKRELEIHASLIKSKLKITDDDLSEDLEGIIILGGDGTILRNLRNLSLKGVQLNKSLVIAVNFGSFGCLAPFECKELGSVIDKLIINDYKTVKRKRLEVKTNKRSLGYALNDILICTKVGTLNKFRIEIGDSKIELRCDSVLISTQSGSSGYNYSGKGPLLLHQNIFVINCLNACQANFNPLVVSGVVKVSLVTVFIDYDDVKCIIDGCDVYRESEFSFELEKGFVSFMSFNDELDEYVRVAKRLCYLK